MNNSLVWVVIAVAVLFQVGVVLAVWSLSGNPRNNGKTISGVSGKARKAETNSRRISEIPETFRANGKKPEKEFYKQLWQRIEEHARNNRENLAKGKGRVTQAALANELGVKAPNLSAIKLLAMGEVVERKPAWASVEILAEKLRVHLPK